MLARGDDRALFPKAQLITDGLIAPFFVFCLVFSAKSAPSRLFSYSHKSSPIIRGLRPFYPTLIYRCEYSYRLRLAISPFEKLCRAFNCSTVACRRFSLSPSLYLTLTTRSPVLRHIARAFAPGVLKYIKIFKYLRNPRLRS